MSIHLHIIFGCSLQWEFVTDYMADKSWRYLILGPSQKKFAESWVGGWCNQVPEKELAWTGWPSWRRWHWAKTWMRRRGSLFKVLEENYCRQKEQLMQRPWGSDEVSVFEEWAKETWTRTRVAWDGGWSKDKTIGRGGRGRGGSKGYFSFVQNVLGEAMSRALWGLARTLSAGLVSHPMNNQNAPISLIKYNLYVSWIECLLIRGQPGRPSFRKQAPSLCFYVVWEYVVLPYVVLLNHSPELILLTSGQWWPNATSHACIIPLTSSHHTDILASHHHKKKGKYSTIRYFARETTFI